ncbi:L-fucose transporter [Cellulophaga lytica DSM 7489]|uniref:L-fucose transporter n=1 Tax=Cellulophaga lytica (strain ATCC 23178 / DSM 7489 / JCM 8516 / NBRC 14961 / NCIMB 1423 / VKM B-1433 / Cy l20) TaxID=867900 RepID=F0RFQ5_CELLC|nr:L-fucose:H+ symporter permease [Cellulophaga lytica]ADY30030.1 L-fucose transporter [Cellulophaga lytica DSM 7489]WQG75807.1 L-fucose:H+ symporter permease [Cellulophaga lytica]
MKTTSKVPVVTKKMLLPFILITSLFALWGFANAVTDPMVSAFKKVLELSNTQASMVQMAFYGGYFCMALPAAMFMRKYSYKVGVLIGLGLFATGALLFYPAAVTEQFWFFCLGLYILTFGLAFLETAANPYALAMGAKETATQRLNLAQAFNPVGLIAGILIAKFFVAEKLQSDDYENFAALDSVKKAAITASDLAVIRDPYVILGLVLIGFFVLFLVSKMPQNSTEGKMPSIKETFKDLAKNKKYALGVLAQILYVGAQIMCWTYIYQYVEGLVNTGVFKESYITVFGTEVLKDGFYYQIIAFLLFVVGRAIGTAMLRFMSAGKLLSGFAVLAIVFVLGTIFIDGMFGLYSLVGVSFCLSLMFPTIYGIALDGLTEDQSKVGSAGLIMAIVGGALMPPLQGLIIDMGGTGVSDTTIMGVSEINFSFILPFLCFVYIAWYGYMVFKKYEAGVITT